MIQFSNAYRSTQDEILDDLDLKGPEMERMLHDLDVVNSWLGGENVTISGIEYLLAKAPSNRQITIVDIGCGDGAILRKLAEYGEKNGHDFKLIGIDANPNILDQAKNRSQDYANIEYGHHNIFSDAPIPHNYDIALCTLFLHHFDNEQIKSILKTLGHQSQLGVIVNDLQRNWWAFWLFRIFSSIFIKTRIARHDGLVSVARGFKKKELDQLSKSLSGYTHRISWKWAFRWQWILEK
ncbi:MAG: methyltransferase domain-containing protein [Marinirhabdus sp.]|nr:methyltransferase domain-containing protein [Marinirhabdus sp.]